MPATWTHLSNIHCFIVLLLATQCLAVAHKKDLFDDLSNEDYSETLESMVKPDGVDNEAIQQLIDKFLNKGTLEETKGEIVNKEAHQLINSSTYWSVDNLAPEHSIKDEAQAQVWLNGYTAELQKVLHQVAVAGWNYFTSASPITKQYLVEAEEVARAFLKASARQGRQFSVSADQSNPASLSSLLESVTKEGMNSLDAAELEKYNQVLARINQIFTTTPLCELGSKEGTACLLKFGDLHSLLQSNQNAKDNLNWWKSWRMAAGPNLTDAYAELIESTNKAAKENGFSNGGAMWRSVFELPDQNGKPQVDIQGQMEQVYQQILPFYKQLHGYIRPRLASIYASKESGEGLTRDGPLPVHLLKSLNGENWSGHYELTRPFAEDDQKIDAEILENFHAQNYTVRTMFTKVYRFMKYLGFEKLPKSLWKKSIFARVWSKDMICNPATAYDMVDADDYRIKVCAQLTESDFINAHKLMAQLYYKYLSRKQPLLLRDTPNPSLGSALAGAFAILSRNAEYLKSQNLLDPKAERSEPTEINHLYKEAIDQVVQLPFTMVADKWRFEVFEGKLDKSNWSEAWWKLREQYQGVRSVDKSAASDYDSVVSPAITQQHAPAMRSFVSYVAQFQILKKLCEGGNETAPGTMLSQGCIPNKSAVKQVIDTLAKGASISWVDAFEEMTGSRKLDAGPILQYYEPLISWLQNINQHEQVVLGWDGKDQQEFAQNEIPELRQTVGELGQVLPNDDQIAYPGQSCTKGQECLLDSICNGTICICNASFYTLQIADTYNCVPENPANAGFGTPGGGLLIALNPNENAKIDAKNSTAEESDHKESHKMEKAQTRTNSAGSSSALFGLTLTTILMFANSLITMKYL